MMQELIQWLDAQNIDYTIIDNEVVEIPNFGKMFLADLSGVESIFKSKDGEVRFNLMGNPQELQDEGIFYVAFHLAITGITMTSAKSFASIS